MRHPKKEWSKILDYEIAMIVLPAALMGSSIGMILNQMFPEIATLISLTLVLWLVAAISFR